MDTEKVVYSVTELSKVLGIDKANTYKLVHTDGFPLTKIGKRLLIPKKQLDIWFEKNST